MKKITLILDPSDRGIPNKGLQIIAQFDDKEIAYANVVQLERGESGWQFDTCTENTKLLVVDGLRSHKTLNDFYSWCSGFVVSKPLVRSFVINPQILIISYIIRARWLPVDASFTRRFKVIDLSK
jgi:hypothetical protein